MAAEPAKMVEVQGITRRFGDFVAVDQVSFDVMAGEIFGFLGPNGAGKTTLIRMLTTLLKPTGGGARVAGVEVTENPDAVRRAIGVVPQALTSDLDLTGRENMDIYGRFYGIGAAERRERTAMLLELVNLTGRADELVAAYSGGMRRRLEIARGLVHRPRLLFLDEPTIGLDPQSRRLVWRFIDEMRQSERMTIFLTTHYMEEAEALCDRIAIIDNGRIIAMGTQEELKAEVAGSDVVTLRLAPPVAPVLARLADLPFVHKVTEEEGEARVALDHGAEHLPQVIGEVAAAGGTVLAATIHELSLEDVFIHFTGKSIRQEETRKVSFLVGAGIPQKWGR
ncbi:MAG: ATP-binding cassette domain-containing protein [Thermodesulfobacteriota bacterium]